MDDHLWRLTWALPLVIMIGVGLIYWLKQLGFGGPPSNGVIQTVVLSNTALSEHTRVLVVEVNARQFVVFESTAHVDVQPANIDAHSLIPHVPDQGGHASVFTWRSLRRKS